MLLTIILSFALQDAAAQAATEALNENSQPPERICNAPYEQYDSLIAELKQALEADDRATVSTLFHYPFCVNKDECERYETPEKVLRDFDRIFSPRLPSSSPGRPSPTIGSTIRVQ